MIDDFPDLVLAEATVWVERLKKTWREKTSDWRLESSGCRQLLLGLGHVEFKEEIMKSLQVILASVATIALVGCSSTGVIPTDKDTYMISKQSAAGMFGTPEGVKADIYVEANEFCSKQGKAVETVNVQGKNAIPFTRQGSASLTFRCVPK